MNNTNNLLLNPDAAAGAGEMEVPATLPVEKPVFYNAKTGQPEVHEVDDNGEAFLQKDGFKLVVSSFTGARKGLGFYWPSFDTLSRAINMHGEEKVLKALNNESYRSCKKKASGSIPTFPDDAKQEAAIKKLVETAPIVLTQEEALAVVPGERELSANQILSLIRTKQKEGAPGKEIKALLTSYMQTLERERSRSGIEDDED